VYLVDTSAFRHIAAILEAAVFVEDPMSRATHYDAAQLYRAARRQGITVRSSVDCLVAACAIRANLPVLHRDRDFSELAAISALSEHPV
jgi:predicted nucleic acid-binding protein